MKDLLSNVGSGGGAAAAAPGATAGGAAAADEAKEEEKKEEGQLFFPRCRTVTTGAAILSGMLDANPWLQRRRSRTRIWVSVSSTRVVAFGVDSFSICTSKACMDGDRFSLHWTATTGSWRL